jgi:zinc transporter ZupT
VRADKERSDGRAHGWLSLYALAFGLVIVAGALVVVAARDFLATLTSLWISMALSAGAIVVSVLAVVLPRRR